MTYEQSDHPPKPWETFLAAVLSSAIGHAIEVHGRAALVSDGAVVRRYLIPEQLIDRAIGGSRGARDLMLGVQTLMAWDESIGARPVDDGLTWNDNGDDGGHWCLDPEACDDLRRQQEE